MSVSSTAVKVTVMALLVSVNVFDPEAGMYDS